MLNRLWSAMRWTMVTPADELRVKRMAPPGIDFIEDDGGMPHDIKFDYSKRVPRRYSSTWHYLSHTPADELRFNPPSYIAPAPYMGRDDDEDEIEITDVAMSQVVPHKQSLSNTAIVLGAFLTGAIEPLLSQPADKISKIKQLPNNNIQTSRDWMKAVLGPAYDQGFMAAVRKIYKYVSVSVFHGMVQKSVKYAGQPIAADFLNAHAGVAFGVFLGEKTGRSAIHGCAAAMAALAEAALVFPIDKMKVLAQTEIIKLERLPVDMGERVRKETHLERNKRIAALVTPTMYQGVKPYLLRGMVSSVLTFSILAHIKHDYFGLKHSHDATFAQNFSATIIAQFIATLLTHPLERIKTISQTSLVKGSGDMSVLGLFGTVIRKEGVSGLMKGVTPRLVWTPFKVASIIAISSFLAQEIDKLMRSECATAVGAPHPQICPTEPESNRYKMR